MTETATFAAGCFWGPEFKFGKLDGVVETAVGYIGGAITNPSYQQVCGGDSGHAEAVQLKFDPSVISYEELVRAFFAMHNPKQWNRQGPDFGSQYRSAIFTHGDEQAKTAETVKAELNKSTFDDGIVTQIAAADTFWKAEDNHQKYAEKHPGHHCAI